MYSDRTCEKWPRCWRCWLSLAGMAGAVWAGVYFGVKFFEAVR